MVIYRAYGRLSAWLSVCLFMRKFTALTIFLLGWGIRRFNKFDRMMFSPLIFMGGFYAVTLVVMAVLAWLVWELCIMMYPERFWPNSNAALKCSQCTDKLCTQYCQKLRK